MAGGRKGLGEEMAIKRRYAALSEPFFKVLQEFLESEDKADRKFAIEQLGKGFTKMIPQSIDGGEDEQGNPIPLLYALRNHDSNKEDSGVTAEA